jgi:predicted DsbA family dithiol-disulfide isomerase
VSIPSLRFTVWSDVLCPWCYNAAVTIDRVRDAVANRVSLEIVWKSYLLRPVAEPKSPERFRRYTESWLRPAAQPDAGEFRVWATDEPPPSHSVPPAIATKAAARQDAFAKYHHALMHAYFARNLDVTSRSNILLVADDCGLDRERMDRDLDDPGLADLVVAEHNEAVELGISGVPCVVLDGGFQLPGSQERAVYERVIDRLLARMPAPQELS